MKMSKSMKNRIDDQKGTQKLVRGKDGRFISPIKTIIEKKNYVKENPKPKKQKLQPEEIKSNDPEETAPSNSSLSEMIFLKNLGSGLYSTCKTPRLKLLTNYIKAAKKRSNWSGLNKDIILKYANEQLKEEKKFLKSSK
jgi:hypothetical protein